MRGVSLTHPKLCYVGSFSYTPLAVLSGQILLHVPFTLCGEFLLHAPCYVMWRVFHKRPGYSVRGVSLTRPMLYYVGSFSYTPHAIIMWRIYPTRPMLYYVGSLFYTPHAMLCGVFLLHAHAIF